MTAKGVVLFFLFLFGIGSVAGSLVSLDIGEERVGVFRLALGVGLIAAGIVAWKIWKE